MNLFRIYRNFPFGGEKNHLISSPALRSLHMRENKYEIGEIIRFRNTEKV